MAAFGMEALDGDQVQQRTDGQPVRSFSFGRKFSHASEKM